MYYLGSKQEKQNVWNKTIAIQTIFTKEDGTNINRDFITISNRKNIDGESDDNFIIASYLMLALKEMQSL